MSREYDNRGRLALWANKDRKEQTHPHLSGQGEALDGSACWVSAWFSKDLAEDDKAALAAIVKRYEGTSTKPFINIAIKPKHVNQQENMKPSSGNSANGQAEYGHDDSMDDIPF